MILIIPPYPSLVLPIEAEALSKYTITIEHSQDMSFAQLLNLLSDPFYQYPDFWIDKIPPAVIKELYEAITPKLVEYPYLPKTYIEFPLALSISRFLYGTAIFDIRNRSPPTHFLAIRNP